MTVQREQQGHRGAFFIDQDGVRAAELTFSAGPDGKLVMLDHTEVGESLRGQGIARKLVEAAVMWARQEKIKLVPVCPFARAVFDKEPTFHDVLA
ncbi:MAG: N-acetyltransferase [Deltaproteobacteria bacterium]|nr:MAG: N-acetyltransferase [Deltaproteobacteria bacterium]